jgi:hypothetical protein
VASQYIITIKIRSSQIGLGAHPALAQYKQTTSIIILNLNKGQHAVTVLPTKPRIGVTCISMYEAYKMPTDRIKPDFFVFSAHSLI